MANKNFQHKAKITAKDLPAGIKPSDLEYPRKWRADSVVDHFDIWNVPAFGWCIPTLLIASAGRRYNARHYGQADRTYAVRISDGSLVRIGFGPHVTARLTVHVRKSRTWALKKFTDLKTKGTGDATTVRDRISTRRMRGAMRGWF